MSYVVCSLGVQEAETAGVEPAQAQQAVPNLANGEKLLNQNRYSKFTKLLEI